MSKVFLERIAKAISPYIDNEETIDAVKLEAAKAAINALREHGFIHKDNFPSVERIAMMVAFAFFREIHKDAISSDSMSPHGMSWHNYYKKIAYEAISNVYRKRE